MKLSKKLKSKTVTKKLYGGYLQDVTTYTRRDMDTGIDVTTRISYGNPYKPDN